MRRVILASGALSALLYAATDVLGGLRYPGYSFTSQTISELAAIGAPSRAFVDPLFLAYGALAVVFAIAVVRAAGRNRALRLSGFALLGHAGAGLLAAASDALHLFPLTFAMQMRGAGGFGTDWPHIAMMAVIVGFLSLAVGAGAFAFGRRFRWYSLATLGGFLVLGALMGPDMAKVAAGEPTPGLGVLERVVVYLPMLWISVLSVKLVRRRRVQRVVAPVPRVRGFVAPGFEDVREEFQRNLAQRGEIGAAVAAYWRGEKVVDLWGGRRDPASSEPWDRDTMVVVMSTTKGMAALTLALANARGWLDYDAPVARYWPEFAQNGKEHVTVRQVLGHEAGLVLLDEELGFEKLQDHDYVARVLARQAPAWPPGTQHGYHTVTIGLLMQELIRRVDPQHRTLGRVFHEEIARPLGIDFYIGLPKEIPLERLARLQLLSRKRGLMALRYTPIAMTLRMIVPGTLLRRTFLGSHPDWRDPRWLRIEMPAGNGVGTARALARAYSCAAEACAEIGMTPATLRRISEPAVVHGERDMVLGVQSYFSLGFLRPGPEPMFGSTERAFGAPGAGGSFAYADPDARLGYAYVMNKLDFYLTDDPREKALRDAVYRGIERRLAAEQAAHPPVPEEELAVTG